MHKQIENIDESKEYYLYVFLDENKKFKWNIISHNVEDTAERLPFYYRTLNCRFIDIVQYSERIDLIVDDEGLLVSNNPVFGIPSNLYVDHVQIAGGFLIGRRFMNHESVDTIGFKNKEQLWRIINDANFQLKLIGITV